MKKLYTAKATATGGREGSVSTEDGVIDFNLSVPKGMGGKGGDGANPEQFFASAYAACFGGALQAIAGKKKQDLGDFSVSASISFCEDPEGGFMLHAVIDSYLPTLNVEQGEDLINQAHEICPFSKATRDNIDVTLNLMLDE
ncbi:Ohr family peroxiredoxin [Mesonia sp. K7]|uniref:Ohr family peroxiredoxin n=1 Tax=Mesonia sp. K7 TaxID=2218606 RepID=UPI000DA7D792|nr:Ohr family peroxiredoxin [Mesonia sp. K7]PZD79527.1 Ohr subfamily peroxiredoxin [Mesonia sp. K7]